MILPPRPFASVSEMHEVMVANWNQVVQAQDTVYHLGDIALHPEHEAGFAELFSAISTAAKERSLLSKATMIRAHSFVI